MPTELSMGIRETLVEKYVGEDLFAVSCIPKGSLWAFKILQLNFSYIHNEIAELVVFEVALNLVRLALDEACHRLGVHVRPCYGLYTSFRWEVLCAQPPEILVRIGRG